LTTEAEIGCGRWIVTISDQWWSPSFVIGYDFAWQHHKSLPLCIHSGLTTEESSECLQPCGECCNVITTTERNALLVVVARSQQGTLPLACSPVFTVISNFYYSGFAPSVEGRALEHCLWRYVMSFWMSRVCMQP
jgi:hypothetical protein